MFPQHKDLGGAVSCPDTNLRRLATQPQSVEAQQLLRPGVQGHLQQDHVLPTGPHLRGLLPVVPRDEYTPIMQERLL